MYGNGNGGLARAGENKTLSTPNMSGHDYAEPARGPRTNHKVYLIRCATVSLHVPRTMLQVSKSCCRWKAMRIQHTWKDEPEVQIKMLTKNMKQHLGEYIFVPECFSEHLPHGMLVLRSFGSAK